MFKRWITKSDLSFLLIGPRRAGKTTFLKMEFPNFRYITLDDFDYLTLARTDPKALFRPDQAEMIIDEIQRVPELTVSVKYAIDNLKMKILMTGSSRLGLLDVASESLAGRIDIINCPVLCWGEELGKFTHKIFESQADPIQIKEANRLMPEILQYGCFPEVINTHLGEKASLLTRYRDTYFTRDLAQLSNIDNVEGFHGILFHLGRSVGSLLTVSNFARESGLSYPTATKYLNILFQSSLAFKLYGYQFGPAKRFLKATKAYFCDNGLISAMRLGLNSGQILENFVISEFEKRRQLGFYDCPYLYYYKSAGGAEIDIIIEEPKVTTAVEIKATLKPSKTDISHLKKFITSGENRKGFLLYTGVNYLEIEGVRCLPVASIFRGI